MTIQKIEIGDCREVIQKYPDGFFDTLVTSPPYWSKRCYGTDPLVWDGKPDCNHIWMEQLKANRHDAGETNPGKEAWYKEKGQINKNAGCFCSLCGSWKGELGNEPTPELFIKHLLNIFTIIKPKIKDTGSLWINLGDSYFGSGTGQDKSMSIGKQTEGSFISCANALNTRDKPEKHSFLKPKSLCMVPERFAIGMLERGFILRNVVIWYKYNHMPGSWEDRLTNSYEYVYHFTKKGKYFYDLDAIRVPHKTQSLERYQRAVDLGTFAKTSKYYGDRQFMGMPQHAPKWFVEGANTGTNNKEPYKDNNPHRTRLYEGKFDRMGSSSEQYGSPRARNERQSDSKFLKSAQKTASPGARGIISLRDGKLTTFVRTKLQECGQHLKDKLKHSNYTIEQLADIIGIKETTLSHYFRTDLSGQAIPDRNTWEALQELIGIGEYEDYVSEEIRNALPQSHPFGKNPGDFISIGIDDLTDEEIRFELLNMQYQWRKLHPEDWNNCDVFTINTQSYRESHFATFPYKLLEIPILSTCPLYVCKKCGKPRIRITQSMTLDRTATDECGNGELSDGNFGSSVHQQVGWSDCGCQSGYESGWVLDPFAGSGTTLQFCRDNNRNAVGIELNPNYKNLAVKRARLNEPPVKPISITEVL